MSVEDEVKTLKKHMGGLIGLVKDLKVKVEKLELEREGNKSQEIKMFVEKQVEERSENDQNDEVQNIVKSQEMIEIIIVEHSDSIKRLDTEIAQLVKAQQKAVETKGAPEITIDKKKEGEDDIKKCRYFNKGYCKYEEKCKFGHPLEICEIHLESLKCTIKGCKRRHPKTCKWFSREVGCKRQNCDFLHGTRAGDDQIATTHKVKGYACGGCKSIFPQANYVVKHEIKNTSVVLFEL